MSPPAADARELGRLYDALARYDLVRRGLRGERGARGLEMHKRLAAPTGDGERPAAGTAGLDAWLLERLDPRPGARVLDLGCGFGASLFAWARRCPHGRMTGLGLSPVQVRRAQRTAERLGIGERCDWRLGSYEDPDLLGALPAESFDVALSIETLFHASQLAPTLRSIARVLRPGGRLALVEDMAVDRAAQASGAARELLARWRTARLHGLEDWSAALEAAGFAIEDQVDLTDQVPRGDGARRAARRGRLLALRRVLPLPGARRVLDAFLGGLALEELYAAGSMAYRAVVARRGAAA